MCNNCIHKAVCSKFAATGGHVRECEHFREERRGKWVYVRDKFNYAIGMKCSECGRKVRNGGEHYCPNCGADMRQTEG